jgi:hypothetical protein
MKRILFCLALAAALPVPHALASNVDFNIGINVGSRPAAVVPVPPPPPVYHAPPVVIEEPPLFIEPPELGFHVAVGIPRDIFFVGNSYYLYKGNAWYVAPHFRGPWVVTRYNALPWKLRRHSFERVRYYRDAGYRHYREGRNPYWEHHQFRPKHEWKEARKVERDRMKRDGKDERTWEKEQRKQEWDGQPGDRGDWGRSSHGGHRGE